MMYMTPAFISIVNVHVHAYSSVVSLATIIIKNFSLLFVNFVGNLLFWLVAYESALGVLQKKMS